MGRGITAETRPAAVATEPAAPSAAEETAVWKRTLRFEDAPDVLLVEDAALLLRCGESVIYEILTEQRVAAEYGQPYGNPLKTWRRGKGRGSTLRIPKKALVDYLDREAGL